jgi:hypothetical protein
MNRLLRLPPLLVLLSLACIALTAGTGVAQDAAKDGANPASRYQTGRKLSLIHI